MPVTRDQVVAFIYAAMDALRVTATELGRKAGVDPSTINKFLRNPSASDLSMRTVSKISDISGVPFPHVSARQAQAILSPLDAARQAIEYWTPEARVDDPDGWLDFARQHFARVAEALIKAHRLLERYKNISDAQ